MIKYLFSDLDGTLYINDDVYRKDFKAVWRFVESGGTFAIATGRTDLEIINFVKEERFPDAKYRISANGAMVIKEEVDLFQKPFSQKAKNFLYSYFQKHITELTTVEVGLANHIYFLSDPEDWILNYKGDAYEVNEAILERFLETDFDILKMFIAGSEEFIAELVTEIERNFSDELDTFNDINAVNLVAKHINKGTGIQIIMDQQQIKPEEIAVIGDAANDIDMFSITPNSFTFHHARDFVKAEAAYVVESVAEAIDMIMAQNNEKKE